VLSWAFGQGEFLPSRLGPGWDSYEINSYFLMVLLDKAGNDEDSGYEWM
jgi:hypothetical protein